jgi:hypothetical protein
MNLRLGYFVRFLLRRGIGIGIRVGMNIVRIEVDQACEIKVIGDWH